MWKELLEVTDVKEMAVALADKVLTEGPIVDAALEITEDAEIIKAHQNAKLCFRENVTRFIVLIPSLIEGKVEGKEDEYEKLTSRANALVQKMIEYLTKVTLFDEKAAAIKEEKKAAKKAAKEAAKESTPTSEE